MEITKTALLERREKLFQLKEQHIENAKQCLLQKEQQAAKANACVGAIALIDELIATLDGATS